MNRYRVVTCMGIVLCVLALSIGSWAVASNGSGVASGEDELSLVLALDDLASAQDPDGGCIASGETKSGTIFPAGDTDPFTFYGRLGQGVVIAMAKNYGALYPRLQLYDPNNVRVSESYHISKAGIENYQLKMTGIYTIVASDISVSTGEYEMSLLLVPGATTSLQDPNGGDIASSETKTGNISPCGDMDAYVFYGQVGQGVVIAMAKNSGALYPRLQLYDPNNVRVSESYHVSKAGIENYQLKMTGIYTIVSSDIGLATGEYGLSLSLIPPSDPYGLYPYDPQPTDGNSVSLCGPNTLSWLSVNGATEYDVSFYVGPCMTPGLHLSIFITRLENAPQNITRIHVPMPALDANEVYYWQVVARTPAGYIRGPVWWFTTEPCTSPLCTLTVSAIGQGSITDPGVGVRPYSCGEVVPVTAVSDPSYEFVRWEGTAVDANKVVVEYQNATGSKIWVTVDGAYTLRAVFEEVVYDFPLDSNPGWSMNGQWGFGKPTGQGGREHGNPDPTSGHTGQYVFGVNLNGDYDVGIGGPYSLVAGPFDLSGYNDVKLRYWRWLNTDWSDYVKNSLEMSIDGRNWTILWQNPERADIADRAWTRVECDISSWAQSQPAVYLRWSYQVIRERANAYSGWNLDDIQLIGRK